MKHGDLMTMGQVAAHCGVSHHTAINWCEKGLLAYHRIPGSTHRRVARSELQAFIDRNMLVVPKKEGSHG